MWLTNVGLGITKRKAGRRAPEDRQLTGSDVTDGAISDADQMQRMVNNDLENIPYTMVLAWTCQFTIMFTAVYGFEEEDVSIYQDLLLVQCIFYTTFVVCRFGHSIAYGYSAQTPRTAFYLLGAMCSFGFPVLTLIAAFNWV